MDGYRGRLDVTNLNSGDWFCVCGKPKVLFSAVDVFIYYAEVEAAAQTQR